MLNIFIDESGIHKAVDNSTFALAYVKAEHHDELEEKFKTIEQKLKINHFHWSKTVWRVKAKFMDEILKLDFEAKIAVIKNPVNPNIELEKILKHMIIEKNIRNIYQKYLY
ncbi:hypothetical protein KAU19_06015 [Candidatus Parcubacteria bacterium]|nr:hypothetical protein [Candidatus Parcubacteria bacterium]